MQLKDEIETTVIKTGRKNKKANKSSSTSNAIICKLQFHINIANKSNVELLNKTNSERVDMLANQNGQNNFDSIKFIPNITI